MKKHYYWLDLIRFLAAFIVVLSHLRGSSFVEFGMLPDSQKNILTVIVYGFLRLGHESVLVFFVMSGFLVGGKTLRRTIEGTFNVKDYSIDRAVRIMLPLIGALILIIISNFIMGKDNDYVNILGNFFSLQGILVDPTIGPLWSLSYEVWFYILFGGLCYFFISDQYNKFWPLLILIISFVVFTKLDFIYLLLWIIGVIIYFYSPTKISTFRLSIYLILTFIFMLGLQLSSGSRSINPSVIDSILNRDVLQILFALFFSLSMIQIINIVPQKSTFIWIDKMGTKLALFSYTLYLTHSVFIRLFEYVGFPKSKSINITSVSFFFLQIIICLISAYLIYLLFERHTDVVKKWIKSKT
jgi:peptidoglycan/LPS O-acetylase OafA/YrhL